MARAFVDLNYGVISNGTDNHMMLIDLRKKFPDLNGKQAENALGEAGITINKNMVPFDSRSAFVSSGIRIGTAAVTTRGFQVEDCLQVVEWVDEVLSNHDNELKIKAVKEKVHQFMERFPLYPG
jgi:glycine hydroxymethyltransferase